MDQYSASLESFLMWLLSILHADFTVCVPNSVLNHGYSRVTNVGTPSESRVCPTLFRNQIIACGIKIFIVLHNAAADWLYFLPSPSENTGALCNFCSRLLRLQIFIFLTDFPIGLCLCKEPFGS